jgi:aldehyde:ferredoxin oxidoreductase/sulfur carrier protein ThiS
MKHVQWYATYFSAVTGRNVLPDDLIKMSEAVYNFQRIFNLRMGFGRREHDTLPYRAMGPVTELEYESRRERYDEQLVEKHAVDRTGKDTLEKMAILRRFREEQYEELKDAVYERRGWNKDGIPTVATVKRLGIDFPEVLDLLIGDKRVPWHEGMTVTMLLADLKDADYFAVVRLNGRIVSRPHFATTPVPDHSEVIPIPMVAGG